MARSERGTMIDRCARFPERPDQHLCRSGCLIFGALLGQTVNNWRESGGGCEWYQGTGRHILRPVSVRRMRRQTIRSSQGPIQRDSHDLQLVERHPVSRGSNSVSLVRVGITIQDKAILPSIG